MKLVRYRGPGSGVGIQEERGIFDLGAAWAAAHGSAIGLVEALSNLEGVRQVLEADRGREDRWSDRSTPVLAPLPRPGKIIAIGRNYAEHATEQNLDPTAEPVMFAKFPTSVIGPGEAVEKPPFVTQLDYEAELAVVIGRVARHVPRETALAYVGAYTCLNDVSARDLQFADKVGDRQWVRGKSLDTFCPLGPALVTPDEVGDPGGLEIACRVNGQVLQSDSTSHLIFPVPHLISWCSRMFTLEPGDIIATGTPGGVGHFRTPPIYLLPGDVVTVEIERVGVLTNPVVAGGR